jgi:G1/S-specific cyclin-E1
LQLIGITCLFLAAKVEEIYPPKIGEFAYVTDGACTDDDILQEELVILSVLDWHITPITVIGWLSCYMQVKAATRDSLLVNAHTNRTTRSTTAAHSVKNQAESFIYPQFSALEFSKTCQLVDLCSLDCNISHFPYSVIAAAAISHTFDR